MKLIREHSEDHEIDSEACFKYVFNREEFIVLSKVRKIENSGVHGTLLCFQSKRNFKKNEKSANHEHWKIG